MNATPLPATYNPADFQRPPYNVDLNAVQPAALEYAKKNGITNAAKDAKKVCLVMIDMQKTFCTPGAELYVGGRSGTGAVDDARKITEFIYQNMNAITDIAATMDTHVASQIFHPMFFLKEDGTPVDPFTMITEKDLKEGKYRVNPAIARQVAPTANGTGNYVALSNYAQYYCRSLEEQGKYNLTIWPYHAMLGSVNHALIEPLYEAMYFHGFARGTNPTIETKGGTLITENYSVFKPEVLKGPKGEVIGQRNAAFIQKVINYDLIVFVGEAASHCVAWSIADFLGELVQIDPTLARKVAILRDCMSPVVIPGVIDYTDDANKALDSFEKAGMSLVTTTDLNWLYN